jgi:hypothetical protein
MRTTNVIKAIRWSRTHISFIAVVAATLLVGLLLNGRPAEAGSNHCSRVAGHISGQVIGPSDLCGGALTELGTFTDKAGNLLGNFVACATGMQSDGNGAIKLQLAHTYTVIGGDTFTTSDSVVLSPIEPPSYLVDNHAIVTGGVGSYEGATGFIQDHGTFDFGTGKLEVDYHGQICTQ